MGGIQHADDDFFAKQGGQRADAQVDHALGPQAELDAPVLGQPALGNIQPRQHLDAGHQPFTQGQWQGHSFLQHPVDAEADPVALLVGFEMQVGTAERDGLLQQFLQQCHCRRVVVVCPGRHDGRGERTGSKGR